MNSFKVIKIVKILKLKEDKSLHKIYNEVFQMLHFKLDNMDLCHLTLK